MLNVYIGYDDHEDEAYKVCRYSILRHSRDKQVNIIPIKHLPMRQILGFDRPWKIDGKGCYWDERDGKPFSSQFSFTRFMSPFIANHEDHTGWALFMDCAMLARADIADLFALADPQYALMCVKHHHEPPEGMKMDGQLQRRYKRKNWSSLMLWNLDHPGTKKLTLKNVNHESGQWLHAFRWLEDKDIGELPAEWNVLAGYTKLPEGKTPKIIHYTEGTPNLPGFADCEYADLWFNERRGMSQPLITLWTKLKEVENGEVKGYVPQRQGRQAYSGA